MTERPDQDPITSTRSPRVRKVAALTGRSARRKQDRFRVEGPPAIPSLLTPRPDPAQELFLPARCTNDHPELSRLADAAAVPAREVCEQHVRAMLREGTTTAQE